MIDITSKFREKGPEEAQKFEKELGDGATIKPLDCPIQPSISSFNPLTQSPPVTPRKARKYHV
jgi:hypothetical protein